MPLPDAPTVAFCGFLTYAEAPATSRTAPVEKVVSPGSFKSIQSLWWVEPVSIGTRRAPVLDVADSPKATDPVAGQLRQIQSYSAGWDGYEAPRPDSDSVDEAIAFVDALPVFVAPPQVELHAAGFPILSFHTDGTYLTVEFHPDRRVVWYGYSEGQDIEGDDAFGSNTISKVVKTTFTPKQNLAA